MSLCSTMILAQHPSSPIQYIAALYILSFYFVSSFLTRSNETTILGWTVLLYHVEFVRMFVELVSVIPQVAVDRYDVVVVSLLTLQSVLSCSYWDWADT